MLRPFSCSRLLAHSAMACFERIGTHRLSSSTDIVSIPSWDIHDVDNLLSFCNGIFIARRTRHYLQEETLYRKLIRVFRSTQDLIELSRRPKRVDEQALALEEAHAAAAAAAAAAAVTTDKQKVE